MLRYNQHNPSTNKEGKKMFLRHTAAEAENLVLPKRTNDTPNRYMAQGSGRSGAYRNNSVIPAVLGVVAFGLLGFLIGLAVIGLCIWAIVFGITDIATVGVNPWAIVWIVIGILGLFLCVPTGR